MFNEALARDEKQSSLAKYVKPYTNIQLCLLYCKLNDLKQASAFLEKAKKYSDYDLEDRLQMQIRICGRKIDCKKKEIKNWKKKIPEYFIKLKKLFLFLLKRKSNFYLIMWLHNFIKWFLLLILHFVFIFFCRCELLWLYSIRNIYNGAYFNLFYFNK